MNHNLMKIDNTQQNNKCKLCGQRDETVNHTISDCIKIEIIQTTALSNSARILRKIPEARVEMLSFRIVLISTTSSSNEKLKAVSD